MTSAQTQAALAAALANPALVEAWQAGASPRFAAIDSVDLDTLRRFGGLGYKVRHNGLRRVMPESFRLLRLLGIELDLFAAYAACRVRGDTALAAGDRQRRHDLVAFIGAWRKPGMPSHTALWDMVRHESALEELAAPSVEAPFVETPFVETPFVETPFVETPFVETPFVETPFVETGPVEAGPVEAGPVEAAAASPPVASLPRALTPDSRLSVVGRLIHHDLDYDPDDLAAAKTIAAIEVVSPAPASFGYWRPASQAPVTRLRLDAFSASVLDAVDGERTLETVSRRLLGCAPGDTFLAMAGELVALGIVVDARVHGAAA